MFQFGSLLVKGEGSFEFKKGSLILLKLTVSCNQFVHFLSYTIIFLNYGGMQCGELLLFGPPAFTFVEGKQHSCVSGSHLLYEIST